MPYFLFDQNNSGGSFQYDGKAGISRDVYVEADNAAEANFRASGIGLYFDGDGDCTCCGDRWHEVMDDYDKVNTVPEPEAPFKIDELANYVSRKWMGDDQYETFVHPKDGPFYGAHKEVVYTRKLTYDGTCGYGVRVWNHKVEGEPYGPYAVNEKGWSEDGNRWAPYPGQDWERGYRSREREQFVTVTESGTNDIVIAGWQHKGWGDDFAQFWFADKERADRFVELCNHYLDTTPRPTLAGWALHWLVANQA